MNRNSLAKVGAASHVSCIDRRLATTAPGLAAGTVYAQLVGFGLPRLESLCAMLAARPVKVMARCGAASSEVFLELTGNLHVQYFGALGAPHDEQILWVEGPSGSLREEGAFLWWRKRGWPKFLPWRLRLRSSREIHPPPSGGQPTPLFAAIVRSSEQGEVVELGS